MSNPTTLMDDEDLLKHLRSLLTQLETAGSRGFDELSSDWTIDQLGCDSVTTLELITDLEAFAQVEIPDEALLEIRTIGDLLALIRRERGDAL